jgi:hypothetical protein
MSVQVLAQGAAPCRAGSVERASGYRVDAPRAVHKAACACVFPASAPQRCAAAWFLVCQAICHDARAVLLGVAPRRARAGEAKA